MIRVQSEQAVTINSNMRGGDGDIRLEAFLSADELYNKGRLFSRIVIGPGCSIGYHEHANEMESYVVVAGEAEYDDNGEKKFIRAGDVTLTRAGEGHAVKNNSGSDVILIALILFKG